MNVIELLHAHQARMLIEDECYTCGAHKPRLELEEFERHDGHEFYFIQVCGKCVSQQRHKLDW